MVKTQLKKLVPKNNDAPKGVELKDHQLLEKLVTEAVYKSKKELIIKQPKNL